MTTGSEQDRSPLTTVEPSVAERLWSEYKYRHDLCWRVVFQLMGAAVVLTVLPYARPEITKALSAWIIPVPLVGIALTVFGLYMMRAELERLSVIRTRYRDLQEKELGIPQAYSGFTGRVMVYLGVLLALQLVNLGIIIYVWLPIITGSSK